MPLPSLTSLRDEAQVGGIWYKPIHQNQFLSCIADPLLDLSKVIGWDRSLLTRGTVVWHQKVSGPPAAGLGSQKKVETQKTFGNSFSCCSPSPEQPFLPFLPHINILYVICDPAEVLKLCGTFSDLPVWFHLLTR